VVKFGRANVVGNKGYLECICKSLLESVCKSLTFLNNDRGWGRVGKKKIFPLTSYGRASSLVV